jgi:hypothetical protein
MNQRGGRSRWFPWLAPALFVLLSTGLLARDDPSPAATARKPANEAELRAWLENMVGHHRFTTDEVRAATGLEPGAIEEALDRFGIRSGARPDRAEDEPLTVLPYPGGRHPRVGFLEGAVDPLRETKVSVFLPWDRESYVVADVPEAVWSNLGLTYLAHTHVPTIWDKEGLSLPPQEWRREEDGSLVMERKLPNGIVFGTRVIPKTDEVRFEQWLTNGTDRPLSDLRVQDCVMLKAARGFEGQTNANKVFRGPFAACRSALDPRRWIIAGWSPIHRAWGNAPVPCLHADPKFPDAAPGQTVRVRGLVRFYEGDAINADLDRIEARGWAD